MILFIQYSMNKLFMIENPELFQGEAYLKNNKNYFEGWYFKNSTKKDTISFIPGISISSNEKKAFIQVITNYKSYFISYKIEEFQFSNKPFYIKIGDNFFSKNRIRINIEDRKKKLKIKGELRYSNRKNIKVNFLSPNIMGPFSFLPFMECNHVILSMKNEVNGFMKINKKELLFENGIGYIEKDFGTSFPKSYLWIQGNCFSTKDTSFMLSIANIPFVYREFRGIICVLIVLDKEYRFTTYNGTKIEKYKVNNKEVNISLKKGNYHLYIHSLNNSSQKLVAPRKGKMNKDILESVNATLEVSLYFYEKLIFKDMSSNCGLEIVNL